MAVLKYANYLVTEPGIPPQLPAQAKNGFSHVEQIQSKYPDAIGMLQLSNGRLRRVAIEFEYESKNFEAARSRCKGLRHDSLLSAQLE